MPKTNAKIPAQPHQSKAVNPEVWKLRLFIAGKTAKSLLAINHLNRVCEIHLKGHYHIEVIDLLENPQMARGNQIVALPTLERKLPEPIRRIIGDLSDFQRVLMGLALEPII